MQTVSPYFLLFVRLTIALTWIYQGLWLKVIVRDPHHLEIVRSVGFPDATAAMLAIGACETLLAAGVLSGLFHRAISTFQIVILLAMNLTGILFGGGNISHPFGLLIGNLPLLICIALIGLYGPGALSLRSRG